MGFLAHLIKILEEVKIEHGTAERPVEAFDEGILVRFAGLDEAQGHIVPMCPGEHGPSAEFLAVVGADHLRQTPDERELVQNADRT